MEEINLTYVSVSYCAPESGYVGITLEREDGGQFVAVLTADDAARLLQDLPAQVRIAAQKSD